ncbi:type II and III secretion system protein [candidate division KSB1 bacterium]|nr:type II and III secretion system protein [candidate division KSB1 bacterium]
MKSRSIFFPITRILIVCLSIGAGWAQEEAPREYDPEEYISLNSSMTMDVAFEIINGFAQKYENKLLIDSEEHRQPIGVVVDHMHWKRALEYILRSNQLEYSEHPRHYQITSGKSEKKDGGLDEIINLGTREIEINAVFFEADYGTISEFGIDWSSLYDGKVKLRIGSSAGEQVSQGLFRAQVVTEKILKVDALIQAFESWERGQILARPQIRIMDGQEGKIKVGKNFFLTTRDFAGNTRYSEYESGTILTVKPQIVVEDTATFIHLDIRAEKSDVEVGQLGVVKKITEGRTQVLALDGEETALAGLFSTQTTRVRKGIPILKDLPWWFLGLRYLTGYDSFNSAKKELIILIKSNIVPTLEERRISKQKPDPMQEQRRRFQEYQSRFRSAIPEGKGQK